MLIKNRLEHFSKLKQKLKTSEIMYDMEIVGTGVLYTLFFIEFLLTLLHFKSNTGLIKDMLANLFLGICVIPIILIEKGMAFGLYSVAYQFALFKPQATWWLWLIGFLSCDFIYYFYHWLGHKTKFFWSTHVTHHSSEHFNLSINLRQNSIHLFYRFLFWTPLCFMGIQPEMVLLFESITGIQNFVIHTERIGKLGILDWIINTPSNHRVHHASNPEYIDKNLGGILMIYDHLFGTYRKETIPPIYGVTHNINTYNPIKILLSEYVQMFSKVFKIKGVLAKFHYMFSPP